MKIEAQLVKCIFCETKSPDRITVSEYIEVLGGFTPINKSLSLARLDKSLDTSELQFIVQLTELYLSV